MQVSTLTLSVLVPGMLAVALTLAQDPVLTFSEEVSIQWVTVPVTVPATDEDLERSAFTLRIDGQPVAIESFDRDQAPFGLIHAQDLSGSMELGEKMALSRQVLTLMQARTGELDEMAIVTFAGPGFDIQVPFTDDIDTLAEAAELWQPYGTTALFDAIAELAAVARESQRSRRAIVLVTDGIDNDSRVSADQAREILTGAGLPIFIFDVSPRPDRVARERDELAADDPSMDLFELAEISGGRYLALADRAAAQEASRTVIDDLRSQFLIGFTTEPGRNEGWHRIEIEISDVKGDVLHRTRYFGSQPSAWMMHGHSENR